MYGSYLNYKRYYYRIIKLKAFLKKSKFLDLRIFDLANNELETLSVGLLHDLARLEVLNIQGGNNKN